MAHVAFTRAAALAAAAALSSLCGAAAHGSLVRPPPVFDAQGKGAAALCCATHGGVVGGPQQPQLRAPRCGASGAPQRAGAPGGRWRGGPRATPPVRGLSPPLCRGALPSRG